MKIITYNVNGIRAAISKGFWEWLGEQNPDIICLQEVKAMESDVPLLELKALGYHHEWYSAEKKGYSGVATFSKKAPTQVIKGCGIHQYDSEGRILRTDFDDLTLLNCYFPSGTSGDERQAIKIKFLEDFNVFAQQIRAERDHVIIVGDYNIAHQEIDLHDPKGNKKTSGFLPEEREWMTHWFGNGFTDAFRSLNPELVAYSWWTYRFNARANNKGWRIDYQSVTDNLVSRLRSVRQLTDAMHSDHCPVVIDIDL